MRFIFPRRTWYVAAIIALALSGCALLNPRDQNHDAPRDETEATSASSIVGGQTRTATSQDEDRQEDRFSVGSVADWMMVLVTGAGVVAAFITLRIISRQLAAAEDAASAAKASALAAIRMLKLNRPVLHTENWRFVHQHPWLVAWFDVSNTSNIAARLTGQQINHDVAPWRQGADHQFNGANPILTGTTDFQVTALVPPSRSESMSVFLARIDLNDDNTREVREAFEHRALSVAIRGTIAYADDVGNRYVLRIHCFVPFWSRSVAPVHHKTDEDESPEPNSQQ